MNHIRTIAIAIESLNVSVWIIFLLFSLLFLDSPSAKLSHLAPIFIPLVFGFVILILSLFVLKTDALLIIGIVLTIISSAPAVLYISKKISHVQTSTIADRKPFILEAGYTSIVDYLQKNIEKEITINGKVFVHDQNSDIEFGDRHNAKLFVNRNPQAEMAVIELTSTDRIWHGKEVVVSGVLSKIGDRWIVKDPSIKAN